jgi:hypothetical protein
MRKQFQREERRSGKIILATPDSVARRVPNPPKAKQVCRRMSKIGNLENLKNEMKIHVTHW